MKHFCLIYFHAGYEDGKVGIWRWMIVKNCQELKKRFVRCVALTLTTLLPVRGMGRVSASLSNSSERLVITFLCI
jgi:hypothetical protein